MHQAAHCEPIINAYYGNGFHSEPDPQNPGCWYTVSDANEAKQRMTLKSSYWQEQLSPAFFFLVDDQQYDFFRTGAHDLAPNSQQDLMCALMGL